MGTIKFHCFIPEVLEKMPIIKASQNDFNWIDIAKQRYKNHSAELQTIRCPGINSVMGTGWIQRAYQDITIETNGDEVSYTVKTDIMQELTKHGKILGKYVSSHGPEQLRVFKNFTPNTMRTVLKIQSPWFVEVPKNYSLLLMPVPYNDDMNFTPAIGFLRGNAFLNIQMYWHCIKGVRTIKAGTPLNQMILVKDTKMKSTLESVSNAKDFLSQWENWDQWRQDRE